MQEPSRASLQRRAFLGAVVAPAILPLVVGIARATSSRSGACALSPEQEAGPFYLPTEHLRSAIAEGKPGIPLTVKLRLLDGTSCEPIEGAAIDIWQCDALGTYSGYAGDAGPPPDGGPPPDDGPPGAPPADERLGPPPARPTNALTYLRGTQITDADGFVEFLTIFPGFYFGRVNHIHMKVHGGHATPAHIDARIVHTGQLFFPEALASALSKREPYTRHRIERTTLQDDMVFTSQHGASAIAHVTPKADGPEAYAASMTLSIDRRTPHA